MSRFVDKAVQKNDKPHSSENEIVEKILTHRADARKNFFFAIDRVIPVV
jgi:hypothetical protein